MPVKSALTREPKLHTYEEMNALLAKRVAEVKQEKVHVQPEAIDGRNQPRNDGLAWLEQVVDPKTGRKLPFVITTCGRYTVDAARIGSGYRFSAWARPTTHASLPEPLGCRDTSAEAKELCQRHASLAEKTA